MNFKAKHLSMRLLFHEAKERIFTLTLKELSKRQNNHHSLNIEIFILSFHNTLFLFLPQNSPSHQLSDGLNCNAYFLPF
ncbi:hypothetical protein PRJBM_01397 [Bartonella henselae]|uniref:Uncharacterized protein n=1 Tax=Bartonella henselae TaxID=38323 RepID=X5M608_BARHN|nr:hypothetical protein Q653_00430 [Bartonella henselae JK 42]KEC60354.1 hypothetical protein O95_00422 [Bartonella henselae JK 53]KEC60361.1 hypothetical protein O97_00042 [Bartonella henselae str. Zeus]OLL50003.1 hypothetical protein AT247_07095 [Bartonella henselae]CDO40745.1 hypothetical protein PRJBM_01397 [Bartonella henselae]